MVRNWSFKELKKIWSCVTFGFLFFSVLWIPIELHLLAFSGRVEISWTWFEKEVIRDAENASSLLKLCRFAKLFVFDLGEMFVFT